MKIFNTQRNLIFVTSVVTAMIVVTPFAAFAETVDVKVKATNSVNFCTVINSEDFKALTKFDNGLMIRDQKEGDRDTKIEDQRKMFDMKRTDRKEEGEKKFDDRMMKIEGKNLTEQQKQSLEKSELAIKTALDTKGGDIAALVVEFRANMDQIRSQHRTEIDTALATVKADLDTAIVKAKADCAAGVAPETVKADFQASVKTTHEAFKAEKKDIQAQTKNDLSVEVGARKAEHVSIVTSFRLSIKSAWESFRSLFNKKN